MNRHKASRLLIWTLAPAGIVFPASIFAARVLIFKHLLECQTPLYPILRFWIGDKNVTLPFACFGKADAAGLRSVDVAGAEGAANQTRAIA